MTMHSWGAGHVIADRYRLETRLGQGGMGSVWRAEHLMLKSPVAIKLLDPSIVDNPEMLERFMREAQSAAALRGTYVVQIFDYGVDEGVPFIAMELLEGESLADRLDRENTLPPQRIARLFTNLGRALSKAHSMGIVHRDLKPDNIFIVKEGDTEIAKVLDFGIAKVAGGTLSSSSSGGTRTGALLGTPFYMSPEQARGNKTVDHRTDLWALTVIAFECLVGRRPFNSETLGDLLVEICTGEPPSASTLSQVPRGFDAWFAKGVHKSPDERFQTVTELVDSLKLVLAGEDWTAAPAPASTTKISDAPPALADSSAAKPARAMTTNGGAASSVDVEPRSSSRRGLVFALAGVAAIGITLLITLGRNTPEEPLEEAEGAAAANSMPVESAPLTAPDRDRPSPSENQGDSSANDEENEPSQGNPNEAAQKPSETDTDEGDGETLPNAARQAGKPAPTKPIAAQPVQRRQPKTTLTPRTSTSKPGRAPTRAAPTKETAPSGADLFSDRK